MNAETLMALRGSIRKWERIVAGKGEDERSENCPLCQRFPRCDDCPVYKKTTVRGCGSSPWMDWIRHIQRKHDREDGYRVFCPTCKELAQKELDFLRGLLPEKKNGRKG